MACSSSGDFGASDSLAYISSRYFIRWFSSRLRSSFPFWQLNYRHAIFNKLITISIFLGWILLSPWRGLSASPCVEETLYCLRAWDRLSLCDQHLVSIRVVKIKPLDAGTWTVQVVLDLIRLDTLFIERFVRGG